jgi:hypothetical protein
MQICQEFDPRMRKALERTIPEVQFVGQSDSPDADVLVNEGQSA